MHRGMTNFDEYTGVPLWRSTSAGVTAAASVALLMLGLVLPESVAAPLIALGLAGILAVRLFAGSALRGLHGGHGTVTIPGVTTVRADAAGDARAPGASDDGWHGALVDDALDDSFPASDPPSWSAFRAGPPVSRRRQPQHAGAAA